MIRVVQKNPHSAFRIPHSTKGIVYLVGAGPGDPKLITVKGLEMLKRANVVIYDHLISKRLLEHCQPNAKLIYVGKEGGSDPKGRKSRLSRLGSDPSTSQRAINRLLVREAKKGKIVVRLKGGDPVLFGRGGEEALALAKANVLFEIVPGVTSAIAVPAYAGIPVTHRKLSSSVAMVTGHEDPSKPDTAIRWDRLASATDTLVCLMGVGTLAKTVEQLIRYGRSQEAPCAVIEWGTLPNQRTVAGTLSTIARRCEHARLKPPAIVVVGEVVKLRHWLAWFERKPLFGKRIVVTRPADRAEELGGLLEELGAQVIRLPAIELAPMKVNGLFRRTVRDMGQFDWVFFTSPEGIHWFGRLLRSQRKDVRVLSGRHIGVIGPKTAASIQDLGIHVDFIPKRFSQEGILDGLKARRVTGKRALILSAKGSRDVLEGGLRRLGMEVTRVPIYRTVVPSALQQGVQEIVPACHDDRRAGRRQPIDLVTVTSSSCVDHFAEALEAAGVADTIRHLRFASIGPVTSATVRERGGRIVIEAKTSTIEGLVEAIVALGRQGGGKRRGIPSLSTSQAS